MSLDEGVWGRMKKRLGDEETIAQEWARLQTDDPTKNDLKAIDRSIAETDRQQRNLVDQLANLGSTVARVVSEKLAALERQRESLLIERDAILARQRAWQEARARLGELTAWCQNVSRKLDTLTYDEKRLALDALGVTVKVWAKGHNPRWEAQGSIPLTGDIVYGRPRQCGPEPD